MANLFVQARSVDAAGNGGTLAYTSNVTAGNLLVAWASVGNGVTLASFAVSDSVNGAWTAIGSPVQNGSIHDEYLQWFYRPNAGSGATTVTLTAPGGAFYGLGILEFSGPATTSPLDGTAFGYASSRVTPSVTPTAGDLLVAGFGDDSGSESTPTSSAGWTAGPASMTGTGNNVAVAYQLSASGSAVSDTWSLTTQVGSGIVAFKVAGGAPADIYPAYYTPPFIISRFPY